MDPRNITYQPGVSPLLLERVFSLSNGQGGIENRLDVYERLKEKYRQAAAAIFHGSFDDEDLAFDFIRRCEKSYSQVPDEPIVRYGVQIVDCMVSRQVEVSFITDRPMDGFDYGASWYRAIDFNGLEMPDPQCQEFRREFLDAYGVEISESRTNAIDFDALEQQRKSFISSTLPALLR